MQHACSQERAARSKTREQAFVRKMDLVLLRHSDNILVHRTWSAFPSPFYRRLLEQNPLKAEGALLFETSWWMSVESIANSHGTTRSSEVHTLVLYP